MHNRKTSFEICDTKIYAAVVTLSAQDNVKLLDKLKFGFRRTINWNLLIQNNNKSAKSIFRLLNWSKYSRSK